VWAARFKSMQFKKVAIIGAGFMGGSLGLSLKKKRLADCVWALARNQKRARDLRSLRIFDRVSADCRTALEGADLVVLATPVSKIIKYIEEIAPLIDKKTIVTDIGSTKKDIMRKARKHLRDNFVGSHPLCGSEKKGAKNARSGLFEGSPCIITPIKKNKALKDILRLWKVLGCRVSVLNATRHDQILAYLSGLPHLVSFSLTQTLPSSFSKFAAGSFKDLTRISASEGQLWADIFLSNTRNIKIATRAFLRNMEGLLSCISKKNKKKLRSWLKAINKRYSRLLR
jgi:prephenate dehydrogenase